MASGTPPPEVAQVLDENVGTGDLDDLEAVLAHVVLGRDTGDEIFADVEISETEEVPAHRQTLPVAGTPFYMWLHRFLRDHRGRGTSSEAVKRLADQIMSEGYDPTVPRWEICTRVGGPLGSSYIDLCDGNVVEATAKGWRLTDRLPEPYKFQRSGKEVSLPVPTPHDQRSLLDLLRPFLNVTPEDLQAIALYVAALLIPGGPYPVLLLTGPQGSAKSTAANVIQRLIDPCKAPIQILRGNDRDMAVQAKRRYLLNYNNISNLFPRVSDVLCQLATGAGLSVRSLYTNDEEQVFEACRPIVLNGITQFVERPDLLDRCLLIEMQEITPERRRDEKEDFWPAFEEVQPAIFGRLLDAVVVGLRTRPTLNLPRLSRMADFERKAVAMAGAVGLSQDQAQDLIRRKFDQSAEVGLAASPVAEALIKFAERTITWDGPLGELLKALGEGNATSSPEGWPETSQQLSNQIRRVQSALRPAGVEITFGDRRRASGHPNPVKHVSIRYRAAPSAPHPRTESSQNIDTSGTAAQDDLPF